MADTEKKDTVDMTNRELCDAYMRSCGDDKYVKGEMARRLMYYSNYHIVSDMDTAKDTWDK